jgi:hypothetical protein
MHRICLLIAALLASLPMGLAPAAAASETGSHGWSTDTLILRDGPGTAYAFVGEIAPDLEIRILRCQELWCVVDGPGGRGWTMKDNLSFGRTSADWPGGINPFYGDHDYTGAGEVCFYTGTHYSGSALCLTPGQVYPDLALAGLDNVFASVQVTGDASAAACRDRFFRSYCERIVASQPVLDQYLRRALSSVRIH